MFSEVYIMLLKTDVRDAATSAHSLRLEELVSIFIPSQQQQLYALSLIFSF